MSKISQWACLFVLGVLIAAPINAQESENTPGWIAWMFSVGRIVGVTADGTVIADYPRQQGKEVMLSYSGRYTAAVVASTAPASSNFVVYDAMEDRLVLQHRSEDHYWFAVNRFPSPVYFDKEETRVTLGYLEHSLESPDVSGPFHYLVFDLATGETLNELIAYSEDMLPGCPSCMPYTRRFIGDQLDFILLNSGRGDLFSYSWNLSTNEVVFDDQLFAGDSWAIRGETFWHTGEVIWPKVDERFSAISPDLWEDAHFPLANTLYSYDPTTGENFPFFHLTDEVTNRLRLIQGGQRVLIMTWTGALRHRYYVLGRDGTVADVVLPEFDFLHAYLGSTPDGFAYLRHTFDNSDTTLMHVNTRTGGSPTGDVIWSAVGYWEVSHVQYTVDKTKLQPWTRIVPEK